MRTRRRWLIAAAVLVGLAAATLGLGTCGDDEARAPGAVTGSPGASASAFPTRASTSAATGDEPDLDRPRVYDLEGASVDATADAGGPRDGGLLALAQPLLADAMRAWLRVNAEAAEKSVDEFCEQSRRVRQLRDFETKSRERDAALFLAGRSDWEDHRYGTLHLPDSLTARMADGAWRRFTPEDYAGLDFTWMQELAAFDHWSLTAAGPLREAEQVSFFEAPMPNYVTLQYWVKLRLMKGVHEGNLAQASAEVRHLADLIGSSDTLLSEMIRLALNGIERSVWEQVGQPPPVPLLSADDTQRARHVAFAQMYFLYPGVKREVMQKALACAPMRCVALTEALGATATMRDIAPGAQEHLDWLLAQSPCDVALAQRAARSPAQPANKVFDDLGGNAGVETVMNKLRALDGGP